MGWSELGTQFCLELAFGVLAGLACIPKAPLGTFFYRLMGSTALLPLLVALAAPPLFGGREWVEPRSIACAAAALGFPFFSGPVRGGRRLLALLWSAFACALALVLTVRAVPGVDGPLDLAVASSSALATGAVAGGVGLAMVLGHWYLTVPRLSISWLRRMNRFTVVAMLASAAAVGLTLARFSDHLGETHPPLLAPWGLFYLGARVSTGLALPLLFAWMTAGSLRYRNTRSATGILYASTVLVLIGTAVSISLQDAYGVPL